MKFACPSFAPGWWRGGTSSTTTAGPGIWADGSNHGRWSGQHRVEDNVSDGLILEMSYGA